MLSALKEPEMLGVILGVVFGISSRVLTLQTDYRQYPTYPHGKIIQVSLGIVAAGLGAIAVPALFNKEYTAVTFLALAAQQFRDVRKMERETLTKIDEMELVPRGTAYIEGIAMVFEGRNYLVIFSAFVTSLFTIVFAWYWGIVAGIISLLISKKFQSGKNLAYISDVQLANLRIEGPDIWVDSVYMMNVGLLEDREILKDHAVGVILKPKNANSKVTLSNLGQRQAILHNLSTILGVYRDSGEPALIPMAKLDLETGSLAIMLLPKEKDKNKILDVIKRSPILENAIRMPSESSAGNRKGG